MDHEDGKCITFPENIIGKYNDIDPCVIYEDPGTNLNCRVCKINSIRILVKIENKGIRGGYFKAIVCGSVRTPDRDPITHAYTFMNPDTVDD